MWRVLKVHRVEVAGIRATLCARQPDDPALTPTVLILWTGAPMATQTGVSAKDCVAQIGARLRLLPIGFDHGLDALTRFGLQPKMLAK